MGQAGCPSDPTYNYVCNGTNSNVNNVPIALQAIFEVAKNIARETGTPLDTTYIGCNCPVSCFPAYPCDGTNSNVNNQPLALEAIYFALSRIDTNLMNSGSSCVSSCSQFAQREAVWGGGGGELDYGYIVDISGGQSWFNAGTGYNFINTTNERMYDSVPGLSIDVEGHELVGYDGSELTFGKGTSPTVGSDIVDINHLQTFYPENYQTGYLLATYSATHSNSINLNTTADLSITLSCPQGGCSYFVITNIILSNFSTTPSVTINGFNWTQSANQTGTSFATGGASPHLFFTSPFIYADWLTNEWVTITGNVIAASPIHFSVSTANGSALTCDMRIYGYVLQ